MDWVPVALWSEFFMFIMCLGALDAFGPVGALVAFALTLLLVASAVFFLATRARKVRAMHKQLSLPPSSVFRKQLVR